MSEHSSESEKADQSYEVTAPVVPSQHATAAGKQAANVLMYEQLPLLYFHNYILFLSRKLKLMLHHLLHAWEAEALLCLQLTHLQSLDRCYSVKQK